MTSPVASPSTSAHAVRAILWGGALAGLWDIVFAFVYYGIRRGATPVGVCQSVAGGLLGRPAAQAGGYATAALGLGLHFFIAAGAAATFWFASRRLPVLTQRPLAAGLGFGAAVYFFMNLVVIPLSAYHAKFGRIEASFYWPLLAHMVGVGLPIAFAARRFAR